MLHRGFIIFLLAFIPFICQGQDSGEEGSSKAQRKARPNWLDISYGLGQTTFRDQATSPLFYSGILQSVGLNTIASDQRRYSDFGFRFAFGTAQSVNAASSTTVFSTWYSRLYQIPSWSSDRWNFKVGGMVNITGNNRINRSLGNSGQGIELFGNLFASGKVEWDVSRKEGKSKKFLFIKYYLPKRKRDLAFQLNLGLLNSNYRNGISYQGQSAVLNNPVSFDGYEFNLFSGFRASSSLHYTIYLPNQNGFRVAYLWDAYSTGGDRDRFVMSHHLLQFSFLFNTK
jgi:hypothetical protein